MSMIVHHKPLEALRESAERYQRLVGMSPEVLFVRDGERLLDIPIREKWAVITPDPLPHILARPDLMAPLLRQLLAHALTCHGSESLWVHLWLNVGSRLGSLPYGVIAVGLSRNLAEERRLISRFQRQVRNDSTAHVQGDA